MANTSSPPESRGADKPAVRPRDTVGDLLRRTRQEQGVALEQVAGTLRIRSAYITAIEQSRYDRLPGSVYAQGFVRTYANALGLDGEEAVRRFKLESTGLEPRRDLAFPMPLTPRSMPGGRVVLVAFVLAVCAYAIWHYVSTSDRERPERVAAVPSELLPPAPAPAAPAAPAAAPAAAGTAASQPPGQAAPQTSPTAPLPGAVTTTALPPPAPGAALVAPPAPSPATLSGQSASLAPAPSAPATQAASPSAAATSAAPLPPGAAVVPAPAPASAPALPPGAALVPASPNQTQAGDQTAAANEAAAPQEPGAPRVYGAVEGPSHITLLAKQDCWIQVRDDSDPAQPLVAQRTLRKGDSYRVPDRSGLVLRTGNATGLQVLVDDHAAPALGGTVRNVALDPARLMAGNALE